MNYTATDVSSRIWDFLHQENPNKEHSCVQDVSAVDFLRAKIIVIAHRRMRSPQEFERFLTAEGSSALLSWAIEKAQEGKLESVLAISLATQ